MSETTVSFLTQVLDGGVIKYPVAVRVFSSSISSSSLSQYTAAIETLQKTMQGLAWDSATNTWGTTATLSTAEQQQIIQNVLDFLNVWSQMKQVTGGVEESSPGIASTISGLTAAMSGASFIVTVPSGLNLGSLSEFVTSGKVTLTSTMNRYMASSVDQTIRTFRAAGWDPTFTLSTDPTAATAYAALQNDPNGVYNTATVLQSAYNVIRSAVVEGNAFSQSDSIQQVLMTDYVITGNAMLYNQMKALQDAINMNQQALAYLNSLQDLMNQSTPQAFVMQLQDLAANNPQYQQFETDTFGQTLSTIPNFNAADVANYVALVSSGIPAGSTATSVFNAYPLGSQFTGDSSLADPTNHIYYISGMASGTFVSLTDLNASAAKLTSAYSASAKTIVDNLQYLINQIATITDATPLSTQLTTVMNDFKSLPGYPDADLSIWVKNFSNNTTGSYQTNLNNAVTASQSLNDTEQENLQEAMFVYQEFYQSATSMLSDLNQLLKSMAQNIAR